MHEEEYVKVVDDPPIKVVPVRQYTTKNQTVAKAEAWFLMIMLAVWALDALHII